MIEWSNKHCCKCCKYIIKLTVEKYTDERLRKCITIGKLFNR